MQWTTLIETLGGWGLRYFWAPMLLWTVIAALVWLVGRLAQRHMLLHVGMLEAVLVAAPTGLVATAAGFWSPLPEALSSTDVLGRLIVSLPQISVVAAEGSGAPVAGNIAAWVAAVTLMVALAGGLASMVVLLLGWIRLRVRFAGPQVVLPGKLLEVADRVRRDMGLRRPVRLVLGETNGVPMTFGWRRPVIVLPASMATSQPEELRLVLAHEMAHVVRGDAARHLVSRCVSALLWFHPLAPYLARQAAALREFVCDALVLSYADVPRRRYAEVLWAFAVPERRAARGALLPGMSHSPSQLKKRIIAMQASSSVITTRHRLLAFAGASTVFVLSLALMSCAEATTEEQAQPVLQQEMAEAPPAPEKASEDMQMPQIEGGFAALQAAIRYPESAAKAGIEGRVIVEFVVDATGRVTATDVVKGVDEALDAEAVRAISSMTFVPAQKDGKPVEARLTVPVQFKLAE